MIPMLVGSRFRRARVARPRRSKVWVGATNTSVIAMPPSSTSFATILTETTIETQGKPTLARVRGTWVAQVDRSLNSGTSMMRLAAGITVVSTKSAAIGITALPLPLSQIEWPWLWWDATFVGQEVFTAVGTQEMGELIRPVDSKAMRKLPPASTMVIVFEAGAVMEGAPDAVVAYSLRMLLMPS